MAGRAGGAAGGELYGGKRPVPRDADPRHPRPPGLLHPGGSPQWHPHVCASPSSDVTEEDTEESTCRVSPISTNQ